MEDIYTWAQLTYVWLGNGTWRSDRAVSSLTQASAFRLRPVGFPWAGAGGARSPQQDALALGGSYV